MFRLPLGLVLLAVPATAQTQYAVPSSWPGQTSYGSALVVAGDHDQDGFPDLLLGARYVPGGGVFQVRSGRTGALIRQVSGSAPFESLGLALAHVNDADGDGTPEILALNQFPGQAKLFSGATGALIRAHTADDLGGIGDVNADGRGDYAICSSTAVQMISGIDGSVLLTIPVGYGHSPISVGDVTGDGAVDFALTHIVDPGPPFQVHGRMSVFSGATGLEICGVNTVDGSLLGQVISVADRDGDGRRDVAFAHPDELPLQQGRIVVHSSVTGLLLQTIANPQSVASITTRTGFGGAIAEVPDLDFDGVTEIAAGSNFPRGLWVFSGATGALRMAVQTPHVPADYRVAVVGVPDIDGDGRAEVVYGDPGDFNSPTSTGSLIALRGSSDNSHGLVACFGDGSGTACPCGNVGGPGQGCANTTGVGATLTAYGSVSMSENDLWFLARGIPGGDTGSTMLFFGTTTPGGGLGVANFAGLRCAGGSIRRAGAHQWMGFGVASWVPKLIDPFYIAPGGTYHFQTLYRDITSTCSTANFTNVVSLTFAP